MVKKAAAFAVSWLALTSPALADTLLDNINGVTLDETGKVEHFTGLIFDADGKIVQLLASKDKRPKKIDYQFDGAGRFVVPGIVDSHVALMRIGYTALTGGKDGLPPPRPEDRDVALQKAQRLLAAQGITAVSDMGTTIEDWQTYRRAGDKGTLYIRIMAYAAAVDDMALIGGPGPTPWLYDDHLRFNGLYLDQITPANTGGSEATAAATQLRNRMSRAAIDNFQVAVATPNHAAADDVLDAIDELTPTYQGERRWRLENLREIDPVQTGRASADQAIVSFQFGTLERDMAAAPASAAQIQPWQSVTAAGVRAIYASATATTPSSPFLAMAMAITRENAAGEPFGGWQPQERLTREQALAAMTVNGAYAGFAEGRFGRLEKGARADFVMLDRDPMLSSPADLRGVQVVETWIGGARIYVAGQEAAQSFGKEMPGW
ncbi:hypothetical protein MB02_00615 [Croceicoccus estronivorus]|nr:hypothetical protein MB02_00615 [Croceicoccus estronivorus]